MSFDWYFSALAGGNPPIHEGDPQPGYYRVRDGKGGPWVPIWIGEDGASYQGFEGAEVAIDAADRWTFICKHPIAYETWIEVYQGRMTWPDDISGELASAASGSNYAPANEREEMADEIENATTAAREWLLSAGNPDTWNQDQRDKCQNFRDRITKLSKDANDKRKAEKEPHLTAGREVDAAWNPLVDKAKLAAGYLRDKLTAALKAETERARAAKIEADKIAEEARRAAGGAAPEVPAEPAIAPRVTAGTNGRRAGLKVTRVAKVTDIRALISFLATFDPIPAGLAEEARKVGRKLALDGVQVPGVVVENEETAS